MRQSVTAFILWAFIIIIVGMGVKIYFDNPITVSIPEMVHNRQ